jgi:uncharacterized protein (UPF0333 family)
MNKTIIGLVSIILLIFLGIGAYWYISSLKPTDTTADSLSEAQPTVKAEPKTQEFVTQRVKDFWEAAKFDDHRAKYRLLDNKLKSQLSEDEYIRRQEWLDQHDLSGVVDIQKVEVTNVTLLSDAAEVRTTLTANTGEFSDITKLVYENGEWHKVFESYDTLQVGKTFEEFVAKQQQ